MKRIVCALATSAVAITLMAGTAAAEGVDETWKPPACEIKEVPDDDENGSEISDTYSAEYNDDGYDNGYDEEWDEDCDGGQYPPAPKQVWLPNPVVDYGQDLMAKGKGLCPGIPAIFAVQSTSDWTVRTFSPEQYVAEDGTSWYKFSASELAGLYGPVTVYVKQAGKCEGSATTTATINKKAPAPTPTPTPDPVVPQIPATPLAPAPQVPTAVLSGGTGAAAGVTPAVSPAVVAAAPQAPAAPAAPAQSLPVTGASTDLAQLALVALATGLGLVMVTSNRRRSAAARR